MEVCHRGADTPHSPSSRTRSGTLACPGTYPKRPRSINNNLCTSMLRSRISLRDSGTTNTPSSRPRAGTYPKRPRSKNNNHLHFDFKIPDIAARLRDNTLPRHPGLVPGTSGFDSEQQTLPVIPASEPGPTQKGRDQKTTPHLISRMGISPNNKIIILKRVLHKLHKHAQT